MNEVNEGRKLVSGNKVETKEANFKRSFLHSFSFNIPEAVIKMDVSCCYFLSAHLSFRSIKRDETPHKKMPFAHSVISCGCIFISYFIPFSALVSLVAILDHMLSG